EVTKEKEVIFQSGHWTAKFAIGIEVGAMQEVADLVGTYGIGLQIGGFRTLRCRKYADLSMVLIGSRLGHELHDAARCLPVLRLETRSLDLDFFDERQVDPSADGSLVGGKHAETTERAVGNVDAVSDVEVLKAGGAGDGRIRVARTAAIGRSG